MIRYQREDPGEFVHRDIKSLGRLDKPGQRKGNRNRGADRDCVHVATDDTTRPVYVKALAEKQRGSTTASLVCALRWFSARSMTVERVMTDHGSAYVSRLFAKTLRWLDIRHTRTRRYALCSNYKAERFIQTLLRE